MRPQYALHEATCQFGQRHGRLLVRYHAAQPQVWRDLHASFRAHFPRHGDAYYAARTRTWSVAPHRRRQLEEWLAATFERSAVTWHPDAYDDEKGLTAGTTNALPGLTRASAGGARR